MAGLGAGRGSAVMVVAVRVGSGVETVAVAVLVAVPVDAGSFVGKEWSRARWPRTWSVVEWWEVPGWGSRSWVVELLWSGPGKALLAVSMSMGCGSELAVVACRLAGGRGVKSSGFAGNE